MPFLEGQVTDPTVGAKNPHRSVEVSGVAVKRKLEEGFRGPCHMDKCPSEGLLCQDQLSGGGKEILVFP